MTRCDLLVFYEKLKAHHSSGLSDASQATSIPYNELGRDLVGERYIIGDSFVHNQNEYPQRQKQQKSTGIEILHL